MLHNIENMELHNRWFFVGFLFDPNLLFCRSFKTVMHTIYMRFLQVLIFLAASHCSFGQTYAILADRLIDGKSDQAILNPTVIVRQGKIIDVNFNRTIPDSAVVIDLKGQTILPGLIDV